MSAEAPLARYERTVEASEARVWENVHDWEHLPFLHAGSFAWIRLEEQAAWGWRARIGLAPRDPAREILLELRREPDAPRYHSRTLEGPGAGGDIVTTVEPRGDARTHVSVAFHVPGVAAAARDAVGQAFVALYTRLWDEDEGMMVARQRFLDAGRHALPRPGRRAPVCLGDSAALRAGLPRVVDAHGQRFRVLAAGPEPGARLLAHALVCPHWGGPLDAARLEDGALVCPWHGYRFDPETGAGPPGQRCRLPLPARVREDAASGLAFLELGA